MGEHPAYNKQNILKHKSSQLTKRCGNELPTTGKFMIPKASTTMNYINLIKGSHTFIRLYYSYANIKDKVIYNTIVQKTDLPRKPENKANF